jgi:hypothetical protein
MTTNDAMKLSTSECRLFYKLHPALMCFANRKWKILSEQPDDPAEFYALEPEKRVKVRDALHAEPDLIDRFVEANPFRFTSEELAVVQSWKHAVVGSLYIFRYLKHYTVFLSSEKVPKAYGVLALADPFEYLIGPYLPRLIQTVLLPFQGKIVYDGLLSGFNLTFGGGIKRMLNETHKQAKAEYGIITSLPFGGDQPQSEHVVEIRTKVTNDSQGIARIPVSERVYQFKITLKGAKPPIWRRIQTKDCTLDKLHEHIQTAMGWTNSHLHQFEIGGIRHGDPELIYEGWEDEEPPVNSRRLKISKIVPADGKRFSFDYEYDFGDCWEHEILFEGCLRAEKGVRYPLCVEGERACPPEDVGGVPGYGEYLEAIADPKHEQHEEFMEWRGPFDPEVFDVKAATREMRKGLPNWREME